MMNSSTDRLIALLTSAPILIIGVGATAIAAPPSTDYNAESHSNSVVVTGSTSYQVFSFAPGGPAAANTAVGGGGVFDEHAAKMARLSYLACVATRTGIRSGTGNPLADPADCATQDTPT
ncbi:hypothetical protein, partial [Actinomyces succiniciruminis]|uniref:hypothetical protein n=1 Tax=Actinomyces succiniciruminis TaxID=1522002 RepID=UPI001B31CA49